MNVYDFLSGNRSHVMLFKCINPKYDEAKLEIPLTHSDTSPLSIIQFVCVSTLFMKEGDSYWNADSYNVLQLSGNLWKVKHFNTLKNCCATYLTECSVQMPWKLK